MIFHFKPDGTTDLKYAIHTARIRCIRDTYAIRHYLNTGSGDPKILLMDFYLDFYSLFDLTYDEERLGTDIKDRIDTWLSSIHAKNNAERTERLYDGLDAFTEYENTRWFDHWYHGE